jgi:uncharacterized membrane protein
MQPSSLAALTLGVGMLLCDTGCRRKPAPIGRTEPWAASRASSVAQVPFRLEFSQESWVRFRLSGKEQRREGIFRVVRGELETSLYDLGSVRGRVTVDLISVSVAGEDDPDRQRAASDQVLNWLGVGQGVPDTEREKYRWAAFVIRQVEKPSPRAPHLGRSRAVARSRMGSAGAEPSSALEQAREVALDLRGRLLLHGYEVELQVPALFTFHYQTPPVAGQAPVRLEVTTRAPVGISLSDHDIKPRDADGNVLARELPRWGTAVGREASVWASLVGVPRQ